MKDQEFKDRYITLKRKIIDAEAAMRAAQAEQKALADRWAEEKANGAGFQVGGVYRDEEAGRDVQITGFTAMIALSQGMAGKSDTRNEWEYNADVWVRYRHQTTLGGWAKTEQDVTLKEAKKVFRALVDV